MRGQGEALKRKRMDQEFFLEILLPKRKFYLKRPKVRKEVKLFDKISELRG